MWISPKVLNWFPKNSGGYCNNEDECVRAYEIWKHADIILSKENDSFHLIDAVCALKRSMSNRLTVLNSLYNFKSIPIGEKPKKIIEQLAFLDIIRPLILKKLIEIRNLIEHEDAAPPDLNTCRELSDIVWYFLKTTDRLVHLVADSFELWNNYDYDDINYLVNVEISVQTDWSISIEGCIPHEFVSIDYINGWIEVNNVEFKRWKEIKDDSMYEDYYRNDEDISFSSKDFNPPDFIKKEIYKLYFLAV